MMAGNKAREEEEMRCREISLMERGKSLCTWLVILPAMLLFGGCCNIMVRIDPPILCSAPYESTKNVWSDCICAPFQLGTSNDPIWTSLATITWPFWLMDGVCEVALDTAFLPVDAAYFWYVNKQERK